jgi:2-(1,2-epoxy-1,2-dihydrophenyl)acetyl-CoA isomerase
MSDLNVTVAEHVAQLEIRRGPANYFDTALLQEISDAGEELQADRAVRAIVLCSEGRHFCAGANFGTGPLTDVTDRGAQAAALYRQAIRIFDLELPVVAAVQGAAVGGGLGLACAADFRVASARSRFQANFAILGFHQGFGLSVTLPRIVGEQRALDMLLTSRQVVGAEALSIGLVDRLAEERGERDGAIALARELAAAGPLAVRSIRQTLRAGLAAEVQAVLKRELAEQDRLWRTKDSQIGIAASLNRSVPQFTGE